MDAIRAIEERALVLREMESIAISNNEQATAKECAAQAKEAELRAQRIRDLVVTPKTDAETSRITALSKQ